MANLGGGLLHFGGLIGELGRLVVPQQELRDLERLLAGFPGKGNRGFYRELQRPLHTRGEALKRVSQQPAVLIPHEGRAMSRKKVSSITGGGSGMTGRSGMV